MNNQGTLNMKLERKRGEASGRRELLRGGALLDWRSAERIPWGALLIFAGGIALASAFTTSGSSPRNATSVKVAISETDGCLGVMTASRTSARPSLKASTMTL